MLPADDIEGFVSGLAGRIAGFPREAVALAKASVNASALPLAEGLVEESFLFQTLTRTASGRRNMAKFLEIGGQTREGELQMEALSAQLGDGEEHS